MRRKSASTYQRAHDAENLSNTDSQPAESQFSKRKTFKEIMEERYVYASLFILIVCHFEQVLNQFYVYNIV